MKTIDKRLTVVYCLYLIYVYVFLDEAIDEEEDDDEDLGKIFIIIFSFFRKLIEIIFFLDIEELDSDLEDEEEEVVKQPGKVQKAEKQQKAQNGLTNGKSPKEAQKKGKEANKPNASPQKTDQKAPKSKTLAGGLIIEDLRVGKGPEAKAGRKVSVYYEGRFKSNNKVFDSSKSGDGFKFLLGRGEVIRGWDVGVQGMKVGSKRRIVCPPGFGYGSKGSPPAIPPNATLVFDVELRGVN